MLGVSSHCCADLFREGLDLEPLVRYEFNNGTHPFLQPPNDLIELMDGKNNAKTRSFPLSAVVSGAAVNIDGDCYRNTRTCVLLIFYRIVFQPRGARLNILLVRAKKSSSSAPVFFPKLLR